MTPEKRRKEIIHLLDNKTAPTSASALAAQFGVSRQIIVGDVALLRAEGEEILSTARGYLLQGPVEDQRGFIGTIACEHDEKTSRLELTTIVDNGGEVLDVSVEHPYYGSLSAALNVASRYDVDDFCDRVTRKEISLLSSLTKGAHLHRIRCKDEATFKRIEGILRENGILYSN